MSILLKLGYIGRYSD